MSLSFSLILLLHEFTIYYFWRMVCCLRFPPLLVYYCERFSRNVSFSLSLSLSHSVITLSFILILILIPRCVTLHLRIANHLVDGQLLSRRYCTHSVWLFSCALERPQSPTALWRFRVSTSNSPSGRSGRISHAHSLYSSNLRSTRYSSM